MYNIHTTTCYFYIMPKNYYDILGVKATSTQLEIKRAYRALSKQYHPDKLEKRKNMGETITPEEKSGDKFKEIKQAFDVLFDKDQRIKYDRELKRPTSFGSKTDSHNFTNHHNTSPSNNTPPPSTPIRVVKNPSAKTHYEYLNSLLNLSGSKKLAPEGPINISLETVLHDQIQKLNREIIRTLHDANPLYKKLLKNNLVKLNEAVYTLLNDRTEYDRQLLSQKYHYEHATHSNANDRAHLFAANIDNFTSLKDKYSDLKGDVLKTEILADFKKALDGATDPDVVNSLVEKFTTSDEYKVLEKGQGLLTRVLGLETSSIKAFKEMVDAKKQEFDKPSNNNNT